MSDVATDPRLPYETRLAAASTGYEQVNARWNLVANARLVAFLAAVAATAWGLWGREPVGWALAGLLLGIFVVLAVYHARLGRQRARLATLCAIQEEALARLDRRWGDLPMLWVPEVPLNTRTPRISISSAGPHSSSCSIRPRPAWVGRVWRPGSWRRRTRPWPPLARARWRSWRPPRSAAGDRAAGARGIRYRIGSRALPRLGGRSAWLGDRAWLRWVAWLGPIAVVAFGIADLSGLIPAPLWGLPLLVNLLVGATAARRAYATIAEVVTEQRAIAAYAGQLDVLAAAQFTDPALRHLQDQLGSGERGAPAMLRRLGRLTGMAIPPSSVLYVPIQALTLWDVHVLFALERWKRDGGRDARRWLATLGEAEALAALAGLCRDNPDWTFPISSRTVIPIAPPCSATRCSRTTPGYGTTSRLARPARFSW